jgi:hypothetical protein
VDVARVEQADHARVVQPSEVINRVVEVEVVVREAVHELAHVVQARHRPAALHGVGMLKERVRGMKGAQ